MNADPPASDQTRPYITCREVLDFLMGYLEGEFDGDQRHEFERHLRVCPSCVNYLESYKRTIRAGKAAMQDFDAPANGRIPEGLVRAILAARVRG